MDPIVSLDASEPLAAATTAADATPATDPNVARVVSAKDQLLAKPGVDQRVVSVVSSDGRAFKVSAREAAVSTVWAQALLDDPDCDELQASQVNGSTLALIVEYLKQHQGASCKPPDKPLRSAVMREVMDHTWCADFADRFKTAEQRQQLYQLVMAANYLDAKDLLMLMTAKVASLIKEVPAETVKAARVDANEEQKEQVRSESRERNEREVEAEEHKHPA